MTEPSTVDVVVIGGGVAGLVAARAAAIAGAAVTLLEAADTLGGLVGSHLLAGTTLDSGAESFATRGGAVAALAEDLGLPVVTPTPVPARVLHQGTLHPLPAAGVLGIPTDLDAPGLADVLGTDGLARAREDLTLGVTEPQAGTSLADLVRTRMGSAVLDTLVRPIVRGVHSVEPEDLTAEVLLPRIHERLATHGSLAAALADLRAAAPAGSAVAGIDGGMHRLVTALTEDLRSRGVTLLTAAPAQAAHRTTAGGSASRWLVRHGGTGTDGTGNVLTARHVVLATTPPTWHFLAPAEEPATDADADVDLLELQRLASTWPPRTRSTCSPSSSARLTCHPMNEPAPSWPNPARAPRRSPTPAPSGTGWPGP
ncbi:protoporphyrinogen/coproporphyrinogen oxidase [Ruania alba]|uniref:Oxygen-dependent protoporphyrinogen oxidase n=1 Tax=Ruania alba TaxID=648782 RepID=A0A1H5HV15_9MICO|nr:FAD-dependent oxidoreductase [Ruania alba]SEE31705.1 oxygen-dependent protoporphyrinogen oxidase [Ruania alba]